MKESHFVKRYAGRIVDYAINNLPQPLLIPLWTAYCRFKARRARQAFIQASFNPAYLGWQEFDRMQNTYPAVPGSYLDDKQSVMVRGKHRTAALYRHLVQEWDALEWFLDLGCWNDMTCMALKDMGKRTVGIDIRREGFDEDNTEVAQMGWLQMDASDLGFPNDRFDCAFSFNSFEHFAQPAHVLAEAVRVVRPGGYIYLNFGPLYWSERGSHQFQTIHIPYHQCLFPQKMLEAYAQINDINLVDFQWMNEWHITQYRQLWQGYTSQLERCFYYEKLNINHIDLIEQYPSCFKSKAQDFDNFLVAYIEVLFRKR